MKNRYKWQFLKASLVIAVALALVLPGSAIGINNEKTTTDKNISNNDRDIQALDDAGIYPEIASEFLDTGDEIRYYNPLNRVKSASEYLYRTDYVQPSTNTKKLPTVTTTIYVDDDNTAGPWDGTIENPYRYIQDGVDDASDGDTVFVYNGTYVENVDVLYKSLDLIGESRENTIIDGGVGHVPGYAPAVNVYLINEVYISTFTMRNGFIGVWLRGSSGSTIENCDFYNNYDSGIYLVSSENCNIRNCTSYGLTSFGSEFGIKAEYSPNTIIMNCELYNNHGPGEPI